MNGNRNNLWQVPDEFLSQKIRFLLVFGQKEESQKERRGPGWLKKESDSKQKRAQVKFPQTRI